MKDTSVLAAKGAMVVHVSGDFCWVLCSFLHLTFLQLTCCVPLFTSFYPWVSCHASSLSSAHVRLSDQFWATAESLAGIAMLLVQLPVSVHYIMCLLHCHISECERVYQQLKPQWFNFVSFVVSAWHCSGSPPSAVSLGDSLDDSFGIPLNNSLGDFLSDPSSNPVFGAVQHLPIMIVSCLTTW